ncbi:MAG: GTP cyclohydrolase [Gammaproteobacteria bacterium]|nr:GTP cyclohydrolase [Gammaproteobacteria bacterium]
MFIIQLTYKASLEQVDKYLVSYREFLDTGYRRNYFMASGPKKPRTGGIILSALKDKAQLEDFLKDDSFFIHGIAEYELIEFFPVKFHPDFERFI